MLEPCVEGSILTRMPIAKCVTPPATDLEALANRI
jgi:hypothetical protein